MKQIAMENPLLLSPLTLAYVGDAVYELFVRERLLQEGHLRVNDLHKAAVGYVRASAQAAALAALMPGLSAEEQDVVRRGRNAKGHAAPAGSDPVEYSAATSFEALVGYLYLGGKRERLAELMDAAFDFLAHR